MIGLTILAALAVYLLISFFVVYGATRWARRHGRPGCVWGAVAGVMLTGVGGGYSVYLVNQTYTELSRLHAIARAAMEDIQVPPGSRQIYEEVEANFVCGIAEIRRLYVIDMEPKNVCWSVYQPIKSSGWESALWEGTRQLDGCREIERRPRAKARAGKPVYSSFRMAVRSQESDRKSPNRLVSRLVSLQVTPENAWDLKHDLVLSGYGRWNALPLARQARQTIFVLEYRYDENKLSCMDGPGCVCYYDDLTVREFTNGPRKTWYRNFLLRLITRFAG